MQTNRTKYFLSNLIKRKLAWPILEVVWIIRGKPVPVPHAVKVKEIIQVSGGKGLRVFIETGTYLGHTIEAVKGYFNKIYSIELDNELAKNAQSIFSQDKKVEIVQGDSAEKLTEILKKIKKPTIFWLDAHYSGGITARGDSDTPIIQELDVIFKHPIKEHTILIDDAREFTGKHGYPTIGKLKKYIKNSDKNASIRIENDIIKID